jgi:hypothetical protein
MISFGGERLVRILKRLLNLKWAHAILIAGLLAFCSTLASASPGQNALDFLNLPIGAYSASLGKGNFAGIIGPEAIFLNPGQLGDRTGAFASHQELLLDTRAETFAAAVGLKHGLTMGGAAYFLNMGKIEGYSADNIKMGDIDSGDRLLRLALSSHLGKFRMGLSVSQYYQRLAEQTGNGWGFGGGVSYEHRLGRLAFSIDNIGPRFKLAEALAPLPGKMAFSAWIPIHNNMVSLNLDLTLNRNEKTGLAAGVEYHVTNGLALRAGGNRLDPISLGFRLAAERLAFDYSYIPRSEFGDRHIFSISFLK